MTSQGGTCAVNDPTQHPHDLNPASSDPGDVGVSATNLSTAPIPLPEIPGDDPLADTASLDKLFEIVQRTTGGDFRHYKSSTIRRRIVRRMRMLHRTDLADYVALLLADPVEVAAVRKDLLISVTQFFRDPEVFEYLQAQVFPSLLRAAHAHGVPLRVWVPGCSTGEEAYSLLIGLLDASSAIELDATIEIIGTDVSEESLAHARTAIYPAAIQEDVGELVLARHFKKVSDGYQVRETLRRRCRFEYHDIVAGPPLAGMDMVSFRNVLIYMDHHLQCQVLLDLHRSLRPGGVLLLGTAETVGADSAMFAAINKRHKVHRRLGRVSL